MSTGAENYFNHSGITNRLRVLRGSQSQAEFGELLGMSQRMYSRYERGDSQITAEMLASICAITGVCADWLLFGMEPMYRAEVVTAGDAPESRYVVRGGEKQQFRDAPILSRVPAGPGVEYTDGDYPAGTGAMGSISIPDPEDENAFALVIEGDSMSPALVPGDIVVVSPRRKDDLRFPIAVARLPGGEVTAKYTRFSAGDIVLQSENTRYRDIALPADRVEIVGRVVYIVHEVTG